MQRYQISCILIFCSFLFKVSIFAEDAVTVDQYVEKVLTENRELQAHSLLIDAAAKSLEQANVISNPELEVGLENFGLNEIEVVLTQPVELGGKRRSRSDIAEHELSSIKTEYEAIKLSLKSETYRRLIPLISFKEKTMILDSILILVEETANRIREGVAIGAFSQTDLLRASLEAEKLKLQRDVLKREINNHKRSLSILSSQKDGVLDIVGTFRKDLTLPELDKLEKSLNSHPAMILLDQERKLKELELKDAKSAAVPDLNISGGYLRNNEAKENAVLLSASIALPFFNRNRGEISAKESLKKARVVSNEQTLKGNFVQLKNIYEEIVITNLLVQKYEDVLIPATKEILSSVKDKYQKGAINFIEVIGAIQEHLSLKMEFVEILEDRVLLYSDLYELTGEDVKLFEN